MRKNFHFKIIKLVIAVSIIIGVMFTLKIVIYRDDIKETSDIMSEEEKYKSMVIKLLMPSVNDAISNYYKDYLKGSPMEIFYSIDVLEVENIKNNAHLIKFKALPYIGAHISVGLDHITLKITASGEVILIKFEHIESYSIPPHLKETIIKWPPKEGVYVER